MAIANTFTFGGVSTEAYEVVIDGAGDYTAPVRSVEMVSVPGRNGDLMIDNGRYENQSVEYQCFLRDVTQAGFEEAVRAFRNAIVSQVGYQRLTDTYHPNEYRLARYESGFDKEPEFHGRGATFEVTFDCKPQRYLTSGEVVRDITQSGTPEAVKNGYVKDGSGKELTSLLMTIPKVHQWSTPTPTSPVAISGWSSLNAKVTGKNRLAFNINTPVPYGITWTDADGIVTATGTATSRSYYVVGWANLAGDYIFTGCPSGGSLETYHVTISYRDTDGVDHVVDDIGSGAVINNCEYLAHVMLYVEEGTAVDNLQFRPMIRKASESSVFEPYDGTTYTATLKPRGAVYGGTADFATGELVETWDKIALKDLTWSTASYGGVRYYMSEDSFGYLTASDILCNAFPVGESDDYPTQASPFADKTMTLVFRRLMVRWDSIDDYITWTRNNDVYLVYKLRNPQTSQFTAPTMDLRDGESYVWGDGEVEAFIADAVGHIVNPTLYESSPLLEIEGNGSVNFNGYSINIGDGVVGTVELQRKWYQTKEDATNATHDFFDRIEIAPNTLNTGDNLTATMILTGSVILRDGTDAYSLGKPTNVYAADPSDSGTPVTDVKVSYKVISRKRIDFTVTREVSTTFGTSASENNLDRRLWFNLNPTLKDGTSLLNETRLFYMDFTFAPATAQSGALLVLAYTGNWLQTMQTGLPSWFCRECVKTMHTATAQHVIAQSTVQMLGHPTYVDCELGEAYKIESGELIPLNRYIELGSDLPKLSAGDNEITYDSTITSVLITPKWWQL